MKRYNIAALPGDGIGPEVTVQAQNVLRAVADRFGFAVDFHEAVIGGCAIDSIGIPLPNETISVCKSCDAVLLGAVGGPKWDSLPAEIRPEKGLLQIRSSLGLYANIRPAAVMPALRAASPLKAEIVEKGVDMIIVRELTGGIYFGSRGRNLKDGIQRAYDTEEYSVPEIERIARTAFALAQKRSGKVCSVDKANVLESSRLWRETVTRVAKDYKGVSLSHMYVDNAAMQLIRDPSQFDIILTGNMFGDILSDEASQLTGSIGTLPSASLGEGKLGLYEPIHGSAPDIAGKDIANPIAAILSAAMMLRFSLDLEEAAAAIENAVNSVLMQGFKTHDLSGGKAVGTAEMGQYIAEAVLK